MFTIVNGTAFIFTIMTHNITSKIFKYHKALDELMILVIIKPLIILCKESYMQRYYEPNIANGSILLCLLITFNCAAANGFYRLVNGFRYAF